MDISSNEAFYERKPYYVSVGAGQILEDPQAAAYELEIRANEEQLNKLQELFEEMSSWDEGQIPLHAKHPYNPSSVDEINAGYEEILKQIYTLLYENGTEQTKQHIQSMNIL